MRALSALIVIAVLVGGAIYGVRSGRIDIPPDWNPWATLDVNAKPNFLTRYKLSRLSKDPVQCRQVLLTTGIRYEVLDDRVTGPGCGFFNAVRIERTSSKVGRSFSLSCRAAISVALWERHVLQPAAQSHYQQKVASIEHFGSYSCRNIRGRQTRSQHAIAEAWDIAGFVLADGKRIRVLTDWDQADGLFLRDVRDGACQFFDSVLSPDYNAAHHDHFHLDRGGYRVCR